MQTFVPFTRRLTALVIASALAAGCADAQVPAANDAHAAATQQPAAASKATAALPNFANLVEQNGDAVVKIEVVGKAEQTAAAEMPPGMEDFFRGFGIPVPEGQPAPAPRAVQGVGSGFIVSPDGYILTNAHVVDGADKVTVKFTDKRELKAKVVGLDKMTDVAVIKVDASGLPVVRIGDPAKTRVGEWVAAIGAPFGMERSVTSGIVSAKSRSLPNEQLVPFIQTDVAVNPGNSGGPLFNMNGEVIGINSQIYSTTGGYMGMSFAIPIDVAMKVKDQLVANGKVTRGRIGVAVQEVTPQLARSFGLDKPHGALVSSVDASGPAAKSGLQPGDVIVSFAGKPVDASGALPALVAGTKPGETVDMRIVRDGKEQTLKVAVGEMNAGRTTVASAAAEPHGKLGVAVRPTDKGMVVERAGGAAAKAGVRQGDLILGVNGKAVKSVDELKSAIDAAGKNVALLVQRGENRIFIPVELA